MTHQVGGQEMIAGTCMPSTYMIWGEPCIPPQRRLTQLLTLLSDGDSLPGNVWDGRTPVCDAFGVIRGDVELYQSDVIVHDGTMAERSWYAWLHYEIGTSRRRARTRP